MLTCNECSVRCSDLGVRPPYNSRLDLRTGLIFVEESESLLLKLTLLSVPSYDTNCRPQTWIPANVA